MFDNYIETSHMVDALESLRECYLAADYATSHSFKRNILTECEPISQSYPNELNQVFSEYLGKQF